jgi:hypothetical protein
MNQPQFLALLGFAFVAAWIGLGFGDALLCLIGAGLAYAGALVTRGEVDLGELQDRLSTPSGSARGTRRPRVR